MKLNVLVEIKGLDGTVIKEHERICGECGQGIGTGKTLTIRRACTRALQFVPQNTKVEFKT